MTNYLFEPDKMLTLHFFGLLVLHVVQAEHDLRGFPTINNAQVLPPGVRGTLVGQLVLRLEAVVHARRDGPQSRLNKPSDTSAQLVC